MIICLDLLKEDLEADHAGLPTDFNKIPMKLLEFMVQGAEEDQEDQIIFIEQIMDKLEQIDPTNSHNKDFSQDGVPDQPSIASKTKGSNPEPTRQAPQRGLQLSLPCWQAGTRRARNP
jgi:hypothetical protein